MVIFLNNLGELSYLLPATFTILLLREVFRNFLFSRLKKEKSQQAIYYIDSISLVTAGLFGISWGGILDGNRKDDFITYLFSQLYFFIFMILAAVYFHSQYPINSDYWLKYLQSLVQISWSLAIINFIPIPPFDAAYIYANKLQELSFYKPTLLIFKLIAVFLISFGFINFQMLASDKIISLFNMN